MLSRLRRKLFESGSGQDTAAYVGGMPAPTTQCPIPHCPTLRQSFQHPQATSQYPLSNTPTDFNPGLFTSFHHYHNCLSCVITINDLRSRNIISSSKTWVNKWHVHVLANELSAFIFDWSTCADGNDLAKITVGFKKLRHREDEVIVGIRVRTVHLILSRQGPGDEYIRMYLHRRVLFSNSISGRMSKRVVSKRTFQFKMILMCYNRLVHLQLFG